MINDSYLAASLRWPQWATLLIVATFSLCWPLLCSLLFRCSVIRFLGCGKKEFLNSSSMSNGMVIFVTD